VPIKEGKRKIIIIAFDAITLEAQNSLLKTLEEPADYANFFIITQKLSTLLNTIRSRVNIISFDKVREEAIHDMAKKFMKMQISERMIFVKNMVDEIAKEKKNKKYVSDFVDAILYELRESGVKENSRKIEYSDIVAKYIQDRSPSVKMLMEYLALVL
jgi:DNA polymerase III delta prime subunit